MFPSEKHENLLNFLPRFEVFKSSKGVKRWFHRYTTLVLSPSFMDAQFEVGFVIKNGWS